MVYTRDTIRSTSLLCLIVSLIVCCSGLSAEGKYGGGDGTPEDPYQIWTSEQMQAIAAEPNDWDKHFALMADIDVAGANHDQSLSGYQGIGSFSGTFDGNGHLISNLTVEGTTNVGLFAYVNSGGVISNLGLVNAATIGTEAVGTLVGYNRGSITSCFSTGVATGEDKTGGLVGYNIGNLMDCYSATATIGDHATGGLVGWNASSPRSSDIGTADSSGRLAFAIG